MEAFKNLFSQAFFAHFVGQVKLAYLAFDEQRFMELIYDENWKNKELKQRIRHIAITLTQTLPPTYADALTILTTLAPRCRGFEYLFFPEYVELNGMDHFELSITALAIFTRSSSSEFAVRPFILKDPEKMMNQMMRWANDENEHLRRLASEGCRPRLPWAANLNLFKIDPTPILPILTLLKEDTSEYVRKSVANNLNDISKDHPLLILELAKKWHGQHPHTNWIVKHGCRTLLKTGNSQVLSLFGFTEFDDIQISQLSLLHDIISIGDDLEFSFNIDNRSIQSKKLRIEYEIGFVKAKGSLMAKRFKLSERTYGLGVSSITKKHSFKVITTRNYYAGKHRLSIYINGKELASVLFNLTCPPVLS